MTNCMCPIRYLALGVTPNVMLPDPWGFSWLSVKISKISQVLGSQETTSWIVSGMFSDRLLGKKTARN